MNDRWIGILSLVSGLTFGVVGTVVSLQPSQAEVELLASQKEVARIAIGKAIHGYIDDVERISKLEEPNTRLATLLKFEEKIQYLKTSSSSNVSDLFNQIGDQKKIAQQQIDELKLAAAEADKARIIAEQKAAEVARQKQVEAERKAAQAALRREFQRERICFNRACTDWIQP